MNTRTNMRRGTRTAKTGDVILLQYTARLSDGKVISSTKNKKPLKLKIGRDHIHRSIEVQIIGMGEGQSQIITISQANAFGPPIKEHIFRLNKEQFKDSIPRMGEFYKIKTKTGESKVAKVVEISDHEIVLDANHIFAGKDIFCEVHLLKIF